MNVIIFTDVNGVIGFGRYAGAYRIATELRKAGYSTQVIEFFADITLKDIEDITYKFIDNNTLFVGFATTLLIKKTKKSSISRLDRTKENRYSGHLPQDEDFVQEMFNIFKKRNPQIKIVIGGGKANVTTLKGVDYWFWGLADRSVIALANHLKFGNELVTTPGQIGSIISNKDYPCYDDYYKSKIMWQKQDYLFPNEHLPIEIDRGCIFRCAFCANPLHKNPGEYTKSTEILKEELIRNYELFGTTGYMFCDDTYNDSHEKVIRLHNLFQQLPFKLEWTGYGRVDVIYSHPEQRELLIESGLKAILIGIETLNPAAAKEIGKGIHPDKIKETLYYLKETWKGEIITTGSFIVGLPGESEESIWSTVEWLQKEDCPLDDAVFSPLNIRPTTDNPNAPISKIAANPEKYGYTITGPQLGTGISTDGPQWQNEFMNKEYAEKLTRKIQESFLKKKPLADWAVYSRLRNLGYKHSELITKTSKTSVVLDDATIRKEKMQKDYFKKLLS
ncbi:MAG: radical SAM protein [Bacteroidetes bacterium]|nr:radical SAM protein [Bacteroidota bacterium]